MIQTVSGEEISDELLQNYLKRLVNYFFKILPIRENEEKSLTTYMESLRDELLGCKNLIAALQNDAGFLSLLSILQYLIDNPDCSVKVVKREVFKAIKICERLTKQVSEKAVE